jgi:hypothetical protein
MVDWSKFDTWDNLANYLNTTYPTIDNRPIWALCLLPKVDIKELPELAQRKSMRFSNFRFSVMPKTNDLCFINMQYKGRIRDRKAAISCHITNDGWILLFNTKTELSLARVLLRRLYPKVSRAHLKSNAIEELTRRLLPSDSYYVKPIGCDAIQAQRKGYPTERKTGSTRASLSGPETENLLDLIRDHVSNVWVDNLEFEVRDKQTDVSLMTGLITRDGLCQVHSQPGSFELFKKMLEEVVAFGRHRELSFSDMDRKFVDNEIRISPINVRYEENIETFQIRQISNDLTRKTLVSIVHYGNPYFLAITQDYVDRSTFSVAILENTLTVVPIKQNSDAAFVRLLDMLYARIGEGNEQFPSSQDVSEA